MLRVENLRSLAEDAGGWASLCRKYGLNPTYMSQLSNGHRVFGEKAAGNIEKKIGLPNGWLSEIHSMEPGVVERAASQINIALLSNAGSMGGGIHMEDADVVVGSLSVQSEWVDKHLPNISRPSNLRFIHGRGDSMIPTFSDGDILLVDTGAKSADIDGVYVLQANGELFIKRVSRRLDGTKIITSDNPSVKTSDILNGDSDVEIKGRVVWAWNGKRL